MGQITGGSYGRTVNIGDYNSKKAEIAFSVDEGEDPEIFATQAVHLCHKILHTISAGAARRAADTQSVPVTQSAEPAAPAETLATDPKPKGRKGRPPNTTAPNLDPTDARAQTVVVDGTPSSNAATADAAAVVEDPTVPGAAVVTSSPVVSGADPAAISDDDLMSPAAPEITDVDLTTAITKKNATIENPQAIRKLIGEFVAPPKKATDIPQGERQKFLDKLALLAKAA